jgi:hypothetical protein
VRYFTSIETSTDPSTGEKRTRPVLNAFVIRNGLQDPVRCGP